MCKIYGSHWVEYKDLIDLMYYLSSMEIGLSLYLEGTNNNWTYNLTKHLMVDLETIIAIVFMTYTINLDAYEFMGDKKSLQQLY